MNCNCPQPFQLTSTHIAEMSTDHSTSGALREARGVMFGEDQSDDPKFDKIIDVLNSVNSRLQHIESQVSKIDDVQKCLSFLTIKVNSLESDMNDMKASNVDLERNTQAISDLYDDLKSKSDRNKEEIIQLKRQGIGATNINYIKQLHDLAELQKDRDELKAAVTDLQCRSMKNNLIFLGLKENNSENTEQLLRDFLYHELEIDQRIEFGNVHRFGRRNAVKSRPIVARFLYHMDLVMVKENTYKLRGTPFSVNEQFPAVIEDERKKLYPVMKHFRQAGHRVKLVRDKLFIDGQLYDPNNGRAKKSTTGPEDERRDRVPTDPKHSTPNADAIDNRTYKEVLQNDSTQHREKKRPRMPSTPTHGTSPSQHKA